uniref:ATP synthase subunit b, chloroplastic n=1 Tax=Pedobesia claviformis TaxID=2364088 RepID=A0A386B0R5_9CHLO|nr:ATP synthase CF0 subunit I [Pedobesia claviformis]AYC65292.1 ATP synthase CF0 subunit I [Pedobesia claviformis]
MGFNTNLLDTNIINLAIFIIILVIVVGDALKSILQTRQTTILSNIREAEQRAKEAKEELSLAQKKFFNARQKASKIRENNVESVKDVFEQYELQTVKDIDKLHVLKHEAILAQQRKSKKEVIQKVIKSVFKIVYAKLEAQKNNPEFQRKVTNHYIKLFRNYNE